MQVIHSHYLDDGKGFNDGRPARLLKVESQADYDALIANMAQSGYYGRQYLADNLGYGQEKIKTDNLLLAAILDFLEPRQLLELGCGQGDIIFLLNLRRACQARGMDISRQILAEAQPEAAPCLDAGDLLDLAPAYQARGLSFDLICGFDIWEHLHPRSLDLYLAATLELASDDALFFYILPAFGQDRVFGEIFPLEFEENRARLQAGEPFDHLLAESLDPPIPQSGHLTWAPSSWWEARFAAHGLVRATSLEQNIHQHFDTYLNRSARCLFVFRRDTPQARARARQRLRRPLTLFKTWQLLHIHLRSLRIHEQRAGRRLLDWEKAIWLEDGALETLLGWYEGRLLRPWPLGQLAAWKGVLARLRGRAAAPWK